ncbi:MAG TPA: hybrid sensor histidine kinase/response regulator [Longimicrobiales bacterium]|nr:hybrid sensor histidine kinase/response regulator [Longimicrobiales bacterium]
MPGERILVVDDSPTQLEATRSLLTSHGYDVTIARSGEEGLERARAERFDLVLSDVVMPGMSGYEMCSCIREEIEDPPALVLLTTLADPRDIVRGVECGADNYITKPYEGDHLLARITQVIANRELRRNRKQDGPAQISFLGETYTIASDPAQTLGLLLSSFEELIRTNAELQKSKQRAEAATRARDEVLATVSHDLKNPVGTIYTSATLLLDMPLPPEAQQRQIEIIRRTAQRMDRLIMDLLDVSSMEAGRFSIDPRPESLRSLVSEARELFSPMAESSHVELREEMPDDDVLVHADRNRIMQVLSNLIGNAFKFTPEGGRITVAARVAEGAVQFTVADTGTGIPQEHLARIFDRFWHAGKAGGSGLGLAIAQGIVQAHNGRIWVESHGEGTAFHFTLPPAEPLETVSA